MPSGFGQVRGYRRGGWGFGLRGVSPPWPYVGIGRGGMPRCDYFLSGIGAPARWLYQPPLYGQPVTRGYAPLTSQMNREKELNYLRDEAEGIKGQLEQIESRMQSLESK